MGNYLVVWSATKRLSVTQVCDHEKEEFLRCHMAGNVMCFRSGDENSPVCDPEYEDFFMSHGGHCHVFSKW